MRLEQDLCIVVGRFWREIPMWTWGRIFILKWTTLKLLGVVLFDIKPMADLPSSHLTMFSILHFEWSMLGRSIVFCVTLFPQWTDFLKVQWYATKPTGAVNRQLLLRYIPKMIVEYTPPPASPQNVWASKNSNYKSPAGTRVCGAMSMMTRSPALECTLAFERPRSWKRNRKLSRPVK